MKAVLPVLMLVLSAGVARSAAAQAQAPPAPNPFLGGVPSGTATSTPLALSISDAIDRALAHNLGILIADEGVERERGQRWRTLSQLLPNVNGRLAETRQKVNLAAFGFPLPAGVPAVVGPFDVFDARVGLSQSVFDLHAINDARAQAHDAAAARYSVKSARDLVVLVAANLYLRGLAESARADSADAQLKTAQALFDQAGDLEEERPRRRHRRPPGAGAAQHASSSGRRPRTTSSRSRSCSSRASSGCRSARRSRSPTSCPTRRCRR